MKKTLAVILSVLTIFTLLPVISFAEDGECVHEKTEVRGAVAATCTEEGYSGDVYCVECNELVEQGEVVAVAPHVDMNYDAHCDVCDAKIPEKGGKLGVLYRYFLRLLHFIFYALGKIDM